MKDNEEEHEPAESLTALVQVDRNAEFVLDEGLQVLAVGPVSLYYDMRVLRFLSLQTRD